MHGGVMEYWVTLYPFLEVSSPFVVFSYDYFYSSFPAFPICRYGLQKKEIGNKRPQQVHRTKKGNGKGNIKLKGN